MTAIGDSFVAGLEVPIADKFHVRLEALARRELPQLDVTTSAFGRSGAAPVEELAFWDRYARHLRPRLLVLVLTLNDLWGNSPLLRSLGAGWDSDHLPFVSVRRAADGALTLLPPEPDPAYRRGRFDRLPAMLRSSYLLVWSRYQLWWPLLQHLPAPVTATLEPQHGRAFPDVPPRWEWNDAVRAPELSPVFEEALALLGFALDQFVERTRRDGAAMVILAAYDLGGRGDRPFGRLHALTAARGIPSSTSMTTSSARAAPSATRTAAGRPLEPGRPPVGRGGAARLPAQQPADLQDRTSDCAIGVNRAWLGYSGRYPRRLNSGSGIMFTASAINRQIRRTYTTL